MSSVSSSATILSAPPTFCISAPRSKASAPRSHFFQPKCLAKELHFNRDFSATKKLQAGVDLVAKLVGVTLGPKGRNVVLQNKYGPPKIVNDGETVLKEIELEDPLENIGVKLARQAGAKTNDAAGDGSTTSVILAQALIAEGVKVIVAGMNPVQVARGIEKTAAALVSEIRSMSREVEDKEIADVAAVSAGNDHLTGNMVAEALERVGRKGVVKIERGKSIETTMEVLEGMQFDRGYLSPFFVTNRADRTAELENCKVLLVDKKITSAKEMSKILDSAVREKFPLLIIGESVEERSLGPIIRNKLKGLLKVVVIKAPSFGERKSHYLDDISILTGGTVVRDDAGLSLDKVGKEVLGFALKVVVTKDSTLIVTDGRTRESVEKRVQQISALVKNTEEKFKREILRERIARLSSGIAILKVGAPTEVELKSKMLRIEDALNSAKAAIDEGVVVGGGCSLLRLSQKVNGIKESLDNEEQKVGAEIFQRALCYPLKLIAKNADVNGNIVVERILSSNNLRYGYNAATGCYEDLMSAGILDPSKVVRCCVENAASVAKVFLTADVVVAEKKEPIALTWRPEKSSSRSMPTFSKATPTFSPLPSKLTPKSTVKSTLGLRTSL